MIFSKKIIVIAIILIALVGTIYFSFFKKEKQLYQTVKVQRGDVVQEVSETGSIKKGDEISLSFKISGRIDKVYVKDGDNVKMGQALVKLENNQLSIQVNEAQASLAVAQAQLDKLLAGASAQEIQLAQTTVQNAQNAFEAARLSLDDIKIDAENDLNSAYQDALNDLDSAYIKAYNALETVKNIEKTYFGGSDQASLKVAQNKNIMSVNTTNIKTYLDLAKSTPTQANIDQALSETKKSLDEILNSLTIIRQSADEVNPVVSSANKILLDTDKSYIAAESVSIVSAQQTISSTKNTNTYNINTAQAKVTAAEGSKKEAQEKLNQLLSPARQEDIDLYQAKVRQAEAQVSLLKSQLFDSILTSPVDGQIAKVEKRAGEAIQPTVTVLSLLPQKPLEVSVDIYEEDIVKVKVGDAVDIKLTAFPNEVLKGWVISIDTAEKLINDVAYYEVFIDFETVPEAAKTGMSADVIIKTALKENVLYLPENAIQRSNGRGKVRVLKGKEVLEKEIELGLAGNDSEVEIISGLSEGEEVIIK